MACPETVHSAPEACYSCGNPLQAKLYLLEDKVTRQKQRVCADCAVQTTRCFLCSLPVKRDFRELTDGRFLCARDAAGAVLDPADAQALFSQTADALTRLVSRFITLPEGNVSMTLVDRVTMQELFKYPGREYECPNVWGYHRVSTNAAGVQHELAVLSGLPRDVFKAVVAHEYGHAWMGGNVPKSRQGKLSSDAAEAFCELLAYLLAESQQEEGQKIAIVNNAYTRGQIRAFIDAEKRYGLSDVVDWVQAGQDPRLDPENPSRVRAVETRGARTPALGAIPVFSAPAVRSPDVLELKGVMWNPQRPLAIINGSTFGVNEEGKVPLGGTNLLIRCLAIKEKSARVRVVGSGEERDLILGAR